jgi:hypothetical protein
MSHNDLSAQYIDFLAKHYRSPRGVRKAWEDLRDTAHKLGDIEAAEELQRGIDALDNAPPPDHPAQLLIQRLSRSVEDSIRDRPEYRRTPLNIYVGEFPVGGVNAISTPVDGGFLVLVQSGLIVGLRQILQALTLGGDLSSASLHSPLVIDTLAAIVRAYSEYGDPFYGPHALGSGPAAAMADIAAHACQEFVVAHEYGHILCGHFDSPQLQTVSTPGGSATAISRSWQQEYEADATAYELLLEQPLSGTSIGVEVGFGQGSVRLFRESAPFITLQILDMLQRGVPARKERSVHEKSHPALLDRQRELAPSILALSGWPAPMVFFDAISEVQEAVLERSRSLDYQSLLNLNYMFDIFGLPQQMKRAALEARRFAGGD